MLFKIGLFQGGRGCLLHLSPKFYNIVFLFVGITINFKWLVYKVECPPNVTTTNCNLKKG